MNTKHGLPLESGEFIPAEELNRKPQSKQIEALKAALAGLVKASRYGFGEFEEEKSAISSAIQHLEMAEQPAQGCEFCSHHLYAGTKCKNCGRVTEQQEPYCWKVCGVDSLFMGEFAEDDAKAEAKRIGGTCIAFPLYTSPQPAQGETK